MLRERALWLWPTMVLALAAACAGEDPTGSGGTGGAGTGASSGTGAAPTGGTGGATGGTGGASGEAGAGGSGSLAGGGAGGVAGSGGIAGADASFDGLAGGGASGASGASGGTADASPEAEAATDGAVADVSVDAAGCSDAGDCPSPVSSCWIATCAGGACGTAPASAGTACSAGVCDGKGSCGSCVPQATECVGNQRKTCDELGEWGSPIACAFVCDDGKCSGVCTPGSDRCNGNAVELCGSDGQWKQTSVCSGSTPVCEDSACEPAPPPSCQSLAKTCGKSGNGYCCATSALPAGNFSRSYDGVTFNDPSYAATLSAFRLDQYEITVGRFRAFVDAGKGTSSSPPATGAGAHPKVAGSGWQPSWNSLLASGTATLKTALKCDPSYATWTDAPGGNESKPINCVSWYDAFAFCAWDGGRLPTEAEWNYAASGGSEHRLYPWSSPPTSPALGPAQASYYVDGTEQCMGDGVAGCTIADLVTVGTKTAGRGRWLSADLAGNVWEWVLDVYTNPFALSPCTDCAVLSGSSSRVIRGGSFFGSSATLRSSNRSLTQPSQRLFSVGLRCARGA